MHKHLCFFAIGLCLIGVASAQKPCPSLDTKVADAKYKPGQVWSYTTRPEESSSTLTILEIDRSAKVGIIVHVRVDHIRLYAPNGNSFDHVEHMPFTKNAILASTTHLLRTESKLPTLEGYERWKADCGGVYTISVRDAIDVMQKTLDNGH